MKMPHRLARRFAVIALFLGLVAAGVAAETPPTTPSEAAKARAYRIAPTDKLSIVVIGEPDLTVGGKRVDVNGDINLALVEEVHVAGLTVSQAQTAIENAYRDRRFLRNPQVTINIEEYSPREVSVQGFVKYPGKVQIPPETVMTLKDVIVKSGGFMDTANGKNVKVTRTMPDGSTKLFEKLDVESLILGKVSGKTEASSFMVEPGDTIYVPERII